MQTTATPFDNALRPLHWLIFPLLPVAMLLGGCGGDSGNNPLQIDNAGFQGVWLAEAYGEAMSVTANQVIHYQYNSRYCLQSEGYSGQLANLANQSWQLADDGQGMRQRLDYPGIRFQNPVYTRVSALPSVCAEENRIQDSSPNPLRDFDLFWQTFADFYPAFEQRDVDWQAIRATIEPELQANSSAEELFVALAQMISPLQDSHVEVRYEDNRYNLPRQTTLLQRLTTDYLQSHGEPDSDDTYQQYLQWLETEMANVENTRLSYATHNIHSAANEQLQWYKVEENGGCQGVLLLNSMIGYSPELDLENLTPASLKQELEILDNAMQQVLEDLQDCHHLILDLRTNGGGFDGASQLVSRYFLDTERSLYSKQARLGSSRTELETVRLSPASQTWLKPVTVLTSADTTSAAEVLALALYGLPNVTLMGERSQGALSDVLSKQLPNGMTFDLVNEYYLSSNGEWFEAVGIPVAADVLFGTQEQRQAGYDQGLEMALASGNPQRLLSRHQNN